MTTEQTREEIGTILTNGFAEIETKYLATIYTEFEKGVKKLAEKAATDFITDAIPYIYDDAYVNIIQKIKSLVTYDYVKNGFFNGKEFRASLLRENKEEIIKDLNQDLLAKIEELKERISYLENNR